jgi:hypothetical protein
LWGWAEPYRFFWENRPEFPRLPADFETKPLNLQGRPPPHEATSSGISAADLGLELAGGTRWVFLEGGVAMEVAMKLVWEIWLWENITLLWALSSDPYIGLDWGKNHAIPQYWVGFSQNCRSWTPGGCSSCFFLDPILWSISSCDGPRSSHQKFSLLVRCS